MKNMVNLINMVLCGLEESVAAIRAGRRHKHYVVAEGHKHSWGPAISVVRQEAEPEPLPAITVNNFTFCCVRVNEHEMWPFFSASV